MTSTGRKKPVSQSVETLLVAFFFLFGQQRDQCWLQPLLRAVFFSGGGGSVREHGRG